MIVTLELAWYTCSPPLDLAVVEVPHERINIFSVIISFSTLEDGLVLRSSLSVNYDVAPRYEY